MSRVVIIGGTGHVGTYLVPRLVCAGLEARHRRRPKLRYLPWQEWKRGHSEVEAAQTYDHIAHSPNCSIAKAARMLDYRPRDSSIEGVCEIVNWLIEKAIVRADREAG